MLVTQEDEAFGGGVPVGTAASCPNAAALPAQAKTSAHALRRNLRIALPRRQTLARRARARPPPKP
jgi:hypothetical protein